MFNMLISYAVCCRSGYRALRGNPPRAPNRLVVTVRSLAEKIPVKTRPTRSQINHSPDSHRQGARLDRGDLQYHAFLR